jgi:hypothetical protein
VTRSPGPILDSNRKTLGILPPAAPFGRGLASLLLAAAEWAGIEPVSASLLRRPAIAVQSRRLG